MANEVLADGELVEKQRGGELQVAHQQSLAQQEVQGALTIAQRFPRDEDLSFQKIMRACQRLTFAEDAHYSFPRGGSTVKGASVYFAREFARSWGNIRYGFRIIFDDPTTRTIRCWAWDAETNSYTEADDTFQKKVFRKATGWTSVADDEREMRELTNRRAAIGKRNCLLELFPSDLVEDALGKCDETVTSKIGADPDAARKKLLVSFLGLNIMATDLEAYLGHEVAKCSPTQLAELRTFYLGIRDGSTTWAEILATKPGAAAKDGAKAGSTEELKARLKKAATEKKVADKAAAPKVPGTPLAEPLKESPIAPQPGPQPTVAPPAQPQQGALPSEKEPATAPSSIQAAAAKLPPPEAKASPKTRAKPPAPPPAAPPAQNAAAMPIQPHQMSEITGLLGDLSLDPGEQADVLAKFGGGARAYNKLSHDAAEFVLNELRRLKATPTEDELRAQEQQQLVDFPPREPGSDDDKYEDGGENGT